MDYGSYRPVFNPQLAPPAIGPIESAHRKPAISRILKMVSLFYASNVLLSYLWYSHDQKKITTKNNNDQLMNDDDDEEDDVADYELIDNQKKPR